MKKKEIADMIIVALNFAKENYSSLSYAQKMRIEKGLRKDIWYESNKLTFNALMRFRKHELLNVLYEVTEAIY